MIFYKVMYNVMKLDPFYVVTDYIKWVKRRVSGA